MWERIRDYLSFSRKERLGVLVLLAVVLLLFVLPYFFQPKVGTEDAAAYQKYQSGIQAFQSSSAGSAGRDTLNDGHRQGKDGDNHYFHSFPGRKEDDGEDPRPAARPNTPEVFYFDPNRISGNDWRRLGLRDRLILTISHYIQEGGRFRTASDLKKLYGLRSEDYERLAPYVRIREPPHDLYENDPHSKRNKTDRQPVLDRLRKTYFDSRVPQRPENLDINRADSSAWCRLPGVGRKLAARIVRFRDRLGGFYSVDQVGETFGLPDSTFRAIRPSLHSGLAELQKIDLNTAEQETLQAHPYIRWKLAKQIVRYREQHGGFDSVAELQQLLQLDPENFRKLEPYLKIN